MGRDKKIKEVEGKSDEVKTSGIGHGCWKAGTKTSSRREKIKCALRVI
jgi:hypothetical protein